MLSVLLSILDILQYYTYGFLSLFVGFVAGAAYAVYDTYYNTQTKEHQTFIQSKDRKYKIRFLAIFSFYTGLAFMAVFAIFGFAIIFVFDLLILFMVYYRSSLLLVSSCCMFFIVRAKHMRRTQVIYAAIAPAKAPIVNSPLNFIHK